MGLAGRSAWAALLLIAWAIGDTRAESRPQLLYFTLSAGYRHDSIPVSREVVTRLGRNGEAFAVTLSEDVAVFAPDSLSRFAAVMFFTSGELPLSPAQKAGLLAFVKSGRGFVGVHSATDTLYTWPDYLELIGGYFNGHPWHQSATVKVVAPANPLIVGLPRVFALSDEIYQISDFQYRSSEVLLTLDPSSVDLGAAGVHPRFYGWPLAWSRNYGEGRVFYTALGHEAAVWQDERFQRLLLNGIRWAMLGERH